AGTKNSFFSYGLPTLFLVLLWGVVIWFIGPKGEFMINDDWSFIKALQIATCDGCVPATGWGNGGPSLLGHLVWGFAFTTIFGFSVTTLRVSVIVMALLGSIALMVFLKRTGASSALAFWGAVTLLANPLVLSQSFTFMTDITLAGIMIFAVIFLIEGLERQNKAIVAVGMGFTLAALLTRQIAIAIPCALILITFIHPEARRMGRFKIFLMTLLIAIIPWVVFEIALKKLGSTALTDHEVIHAIINDPLNLGVYGYLRLLFDRVVIGVGYVSVLVSPVVALNLKELYSKKIFRTYLKALTIFFLFLQAGILTGMVHPPVAFFRNIIIDFGIGPLLLKDTYILHIPRVWQIPVSLYYCLAFWSAINAFALAMMAYSSISNIVDRARDKDIEPPSLTPTFSLALVIVYSGIILFTGYHDRYLIPVCIFIIVWIISEKYETLNLVFWKNSLVPAFVAIIIIGCFSVGAVHDLVKTKTALKQAQDYVVNDLAVPPCSLDGGFEFNGFNCYKKGYVQKPGLSWWWVDREDYVLTLGPLPGYTVEKIFPFQRIFPKDGAIYVLKNDNKIFPHNAQLATEK
ncbi:MAG: glycosyltransferase family 39 protein, partial [Pseudomonadota bacterium]